jgi:chemotaxis protein MotB
MAKGKRGHAAEFENEERWLLTYADMITLLMALFMVLFSISSVNISKYQTLQESLKAAFSGSVLSGGMAILQSGSISTASHTPATSEVPAISPLTPNIPKPIDISGGSAQAAVNALNKAQTQTGGAPISITAKQLQAALNEIAKSAAEQNEFERLAARINAYAQLHHFSSQVFAAIQPNGLVVTILTDKLLFASGSDQIETPGIPLLGEVAQLIKLDDGQHTVDVAGYTDPNPIDTAQFPDNWYLSTARASTVVDFLIQQGINPNILEDSGYGKYHPAVLNTGPAAWARNRRVEITFLRNNPDLAP